ncbi:hypothetical protein ARMGADRAFT_88003 [Armillaria gallica]|uniref:Uncharacterized protein n=1 Tax=Armillaria gallica TaxID=47427 RepID=A0A2H3CP25_ARMGA|nr:hypothetical protein ARMGADRAFT_185342 [Armillaria gallica]PBK80148.1 hypothetical protein ARMGADRAFT_88003 [Armillaria gallica]
MSSRSAKVVVERTLVSRSPDGCRGRKKLKGEMVELRNRTLARLDQSGDPTHVGCGCHVPLLAGKRYVASEQNPTQILASNVGILKGEIVVEDSETLE